MSNAQVNGLPPGDGSCPPAASEEIWTDDELDVIRRLTASKDLTIMGLLRQGLRMYQLVEEGHAVLYVNGESPGCGMVD